VTQDKKLQRTVIKTGDQANFADEQEAALERQERMIEAKRAESQSQQVVQVPAEPSADYHQVIKFSLPNGAAIEMARPKGALHFKLGQMYRGCQDDPSMGIARALMYVRSINGRQLYPPQSKDDIMLIADQLGDDGTEIVGHKFIENFAFVQLDDVKKNV